MYMTAKTKDSTIETARLSDSSRHRDISTVKRVKAAVDKKTSYLLEGLVINVADALFEEMHGMEEKETLRSHFNITRSLKTHYAPCVDENAILMNLSWVNLIKKKDILSVPEPGSEVSAMLRAFITKNSNHYKVLLEEIRLRFSDLTQSDLRYHPLLPDNFYLCFWHSTEQLGLEFEERKLVLPLFNRFVMDRFGQILSTANQTLIEQGVSQFDQTA